MKKVIIVGTTMFSAELAEILREEGYEILGFTVDSAYIVSDEYYNYQVFPFERIKERLDLRSLEFVLALGYSKMNDNRKSKFNQCKSNGYKVFTFISKHAQVYSQHIGEGSVIMPGCYIGHYSKIGDCSVVRPGTVLAHHDEIGDYNWIADGCTFGGGVKMGSNCFIGLGSTVRNEVSIVDYTLVGAHTYIGKNTEKNKVYYGVPAKVANEDSLEIIKRV